MKKNLITILVVAAVIIVVAGGIWIGKGLSGETQSRMEAPAELQ